MNRSQMMSRRWFLGGLGAAAVSGCATSGRGTGCEEVRFAAIGVGGVGWGVTSSLIKAGARLVAICDIDKGAIAAMSRKHPGVPCFTDYRRMLKEVGDTFNTVHVSTPDHTHAYIAIDCMNEGKNVYVQKPLARTVEECEAIRAVAARTGVVCQMGNQGHPGVARYDALKAADKWGEVQEIESWSDRPIWPQGMTEYPRPQPFTSSVDAQSWDCWVGPSRDHGFNRAYHNFNWRGWWDYGCGAMGDMAVHNADPAFHTFGLGLPVRVVGDTCGAGPVTIAYPKKSVVKMTFANGMRFTWYDGGLKPEVRPNMIPGLKLGGNGLIIHGSKATTYGGSHADKPRVIAAGDHAWNGESVRVRDAVEAEMEGVRPWDHVEEFLEACKKGNPELCGSCPNYAAPLTEALLIGCISLRFPGRVLEFSPERMQFTNCAEANAFLKAPSRGAWDFAAVQRERFSLWF